MLEPAPSAAPLISLDDPRALERDLVGGKAVGLARLRAAGLPTPPGLVLPTTAIPAARLLDQLSPSLRALLPEIVERLGEGPLAVRSSSVAEDRISGAMAGQFHTVLGVEGVEALEDAVLRCLASAHAPHVRAVTGCAPRMAVLVQPLVPAEAAGVAFSADPVTGERDTVCVEAALGLGEGLAQGRGTPEAWRVVGDTAEQLHQDDAPVLTQMQALALAALVCRAEAAADGVPQDVEWALEGGAPVLLQSRPITSLPAAPIPMNEPLPEGDWERDDHHTVLSPLARFLFRGLEVGFKEMIDLVGLPLERREWMCHNGWVYQRMLPVGGSGGSGAPPPRPILWLVSRLLPAFRRCNHAATTYLDGRGWRQSAAQWEAHRPEQEARLRELGALRLGTLSDDALADHLDEVRAFAVESFRWHGRMMQAIMPGALLSLFCEEHLGWGPAETMRLMGGSATETVGDISRLEEALEGWSGGIPRCLEGPLGPATAHRLREEAPALADIFDAWMETEGLRVLGYDLVNPTLRERPEIGLTVLRGVLRDPDATRRQAAAHAEALAATRAEALAALPEALHDAFEAHLTDARLFWRIRDADGLIHISAPSALLRLAALEMGQRMARRGHLAQPEDALMLEIDELSAASRSGEDRTALADRRRGERAWALQQDAPQHLGAPPGAFPDFTAFPRGLRQTMAIFDWLIRTEERLAPDSDAADRLEGRANGGGRYTGTVRVVLGPQDFHRLRPGEVMVCRITTPTWASLFAVAGALVTDEGSHISHPAIAAREAGVPAVLCTVRGTQRLRDGQRVEVDGDRGIVRILS